MPEEATSSTPSSALRAYLDDTRHLVLDEIRRIVPRDDTRGEVLYDLIMDYPLREAKGLRPALCVATCRALGGRLEAVLRTAAVLELYHNAFLIHDDIEDGSEMRRGGPTLHQDVGIPVAVNVGDAMLCMSLQPLLDNMATVGLGPALRVLQAVAHMTRASVEGQAIELDWVRHNRCDLSDDDYIEMVVGKTGWYSFITPMQVGAMCAGAPAAQIDAFEGFARDLGVAFQIQDDVLNLAGEVGAYGKEIGGDLWEGKRTLILLHALRTCTPDERARAREILARPRPCADPSLRQAQAALLDALQADGDLSNDGRARLESAGFGHEQGVKTEEDVRWLDALLRRQGSIAYAAGVAAEHAARAADALAAMDFMPPSTHRQVLEAVVAYVHERSW